MDRGDKFVVEASLPGVTPEDIEVSIEDNMLSIKGAGKSEEQLKQGEHIIRERRTGAFHRSLRLPNTVDTDRAEPHYENGVLTVTLPKADTRRVRQLKVTTGKAPEGETQ
jgi:HSP20 family protein